MATDPVAMTTPPPVIDAAPGSARVVRRDVSGWESDRQPSSVDHPAAVGGLRAEPPVNSMPTSTRQNNKVCRQSTTRGAETSLS